MTGSMGLNSCLECLFMGAGDTRALGVACLGPRSPVEGVLITSSFFFFFFIFFDVWKIYKRQDQKLQTYNFSNRFIWRFIKVSFPHGAIYIRPIPWMLRQGSTRSEITGFSAPLEMGFSAGVKALEKRLSYQIFFSIFLEIEIKKIKYPLCPRVSESVIHMRTYYNACC